jgi:hypothetical protein
MKQGLQSDLNLINNIKSGKDVNRALLELIQRHSGIYVNMIEAFAAKTSNYINYTELIEEKDYYIYKSVLKFNPRKGAKFSTHLGNETRWMCLNLYNKNKKNNENLANAIKNQDPILNPLDAREEQKKRESQEILDKVMKIVDTVPDKRIKEIFLLRYIEGKGNKVMPWKAISKTVGLSIQGCINAHNSMLKNIKEIIKES